MPARSAPGYRALQAAVVLTTLYLCAGELLPQPLMSHEFKRTWAKQQVLLLMTLSGLLVLLSMGCSELGGALVRSDPIASASQLLAVLNVVPLVAAAGVTPWFMESDNCPTAPDHDCDYLAILLDVVGLISSRLARLDLGVSLLLAARGDAAWLLGATGGWLGYAEAVPLHRTAGWWCAAQSALHSVAYLLFYVETGGLLSLWRECFPVALPSGQARFEPTPRCDRSRPILPPQRPSAPRVRDWPRPATTAAAERLGPKRGSSTGWGSSTSLDSSRRPRSSSSCSRRGHAPARPPTTSSKGCTCRPPCSSSPAARCTTCPS